MRATFVMEQHLGHFSYYQNLRRFIDRVPEIEALWVEVNYNQPGSLWSRLPGFPKRISGTLAGRSQVRRGLHHKDYDLALFNTQVPAAIGGKRILQKPYVICTDITPAQYDRMGAQYGHKPDRKTLLSSYKHKVNKEIFRRAARILPWSSWTRESLVSDYQVDPIQVEVLYPGIDLTTWQPGEQKKGNRVRVLFVGGELQRKGGDLLLKALQCLPQGLVEIVLVTRSAVAAQEGVTVFNQMQPNSPDLVRLYQSCDIFALPSRAEAFGIAAVEASAVGLPVVATSIGGLGEIVMDGKTGFVVPMNDVSALAERLRCLAENVDLRRELGQAARQHAEIHFDARKNARRMIDILFEINQLFKN